MDTWIGHVDASPFTHATLSVYLSFFIPHPIAFLFIRPVLSFSHVVQNFKSDRNATFFRSNCQGAKAAKPLIWLEVYGIILHQSTVWTLDWDLSQKHKVYSLNQLQKVFFFSFFLWINQLPKDCKKLKKLSEDLDILWVFRLATPVTATRG